MHYNDGENRGIKLFNERFDGEISPGKTFSKANSREKLATFIFVQACVLGKHIFEHIKKLRGNCDAYTMWKATISVVS